MSIGPFATAVAVVSFGLSSAHPVAQAPRAADAAVDTALFKAADAMGMLRGLRQEDSLTTYEFWATGSVLADGALVRVAEYRGSVRFQAVPSMRADVRLSGPNARRLVHSVAGRHAWDESAPGIYAGPAAGGQPAERLLRMLSLPHGVVKTARRAGAATTVTMIGDKTVLSFPVPSLDGATMTATLTDRYLVERVEARLGELRLDTEYSRYGDWNERDYKSDVQFPQRIVQKRGDTVVLDLTVTRTNTYNPYVVVPVPAELKPVTTKPAP